MTPKKEKKIIIIAPARLHFALAKIISLNNLPNVIFIEKIPKEIFNHTEETKLFIIPDNADTVIEQTAFFYTIFYPPFKPGALLDSLLNFLEDNRTTRQAHEIITIGPYRLKPSLYLMTTEDEQTIRLTEKECAILLYLHNENGRVVEKHALLENIWGYGSTIETHTLETHIYRLRQKIEKNPASPSILLTEETGYRLKT